MSAWGRSLYGEPCRECAFSWDIDVDAADGIIAGAARRFREDVGGSDAAPRSSPGRWSAADYVWHVADNLRVWAERVAALAISGEGAVVTYDPEALAAARGYERMPVGAALWSLERATHDWNAALTAARRSPHRLLHHPAGGALSLLDVRRQLAHEAQHHALDVQRALTARA